MYLNAPADVVVVETMNWRYMALFGALLLFAGAFATPFNASAQNQQNLTRWTGGATDNVAVTEGGNISSMNLSANTLTDRWAAFFGNLTGSIYLTDAGGATTNYVYTWTASASSGGYACASNSSAYDFTTASTATATGINTYFNLGAASDNATATFTTNGCTLNFAGQGAIAGVLDVATGNNAGDSFKTCAINSSTSSYAFCTAANSTGKNYLGNDANYEIMVPTAPGTALMTYYFYAELA
jgi:hypothetical protein